MNHEEIKSIMITRIKKQEFFTIEYNKKENKYKLFFANLMSIHFSTKQKARCFGDMLLAKQRGKRNGSRDKISTGKIKLHSYAK